MTVSKDMLLTELQDLLRLTAFEQTIATIRRTQARTTDLEAELAANVGKARERSALLVGAIRDLGGVPDVVGSAVSKAGAFATSQLNQVQTLQNALLGDLTLEHQLRERTRYARTLAVSLGQSSVVPVLDRLEGAHSETIGWLEERLSEVGRTGTSLLRATPVQAAVGNVRQVLGTPLGYAAQGINRVTGLVGKLAHRTGADKATEQVVEKADAALDKGVHAARAATQKAEDVAEQVVAKTEDVASDVAGEGKDVAGEVKDVAADAKDKAQDVADEVKDTAKDAGAAVEETAEQVAAKAAEQAKQAAAKTEDVLEGVEIDLNAAEAPKHPFAGYEKLTGDSVIRHAADTEDVEELRQLLAFEQANKARKGVLAAAQDRLTELSAKA